MSEPLRMIALGGAMGVVVAGTLAAPQFFTAVADEPVAAIQETIATLFPAQAVDPRMFRRFDISLDESVSTEVERTMLVTKIGFGRKATVAIVETATGTYSSDAIVSPHVRYPGIEVEAKGGNSAYRVTEWRSANGVARWTVLNRGSFTYYTYSFEPAGG